MDLSQLSLNDEDYLVSDMSTELNSQVPAFTDFLILARPYTSDLCFNEFSVENVTNRCHEKMAESDLWSIEAVDGDEVKACKSFPLSVISDNLVTRSACSVLLLGVAMLVFLAMWSSNYLDFC